MVRYVCVGYGRKKTLSSATPPFGVKRDVSIILPTYNEEDNIEKLVEGLRKEFRDLNYEIVILDDNSKDKTPEIIDKLAKKGDVLAIHRFDKKGYFEAYIDAIDIAHGTYVITMDSDFSHPPEIARSFWNYKDNPRKPRGCVFHAYIFVGTCSKNLKFHSLFPEYFYMS